ncbi:MAG: WYL domain-containing protein [Alphaproteobacteria bacterium]|nr:WYL domain-containing protein [Alphaproteobacteria bacterium]
MAKKQDKTTVNITVDISHHVLNMLKKAKEKAAGNYNKNPFYELDYDIVPDRIIDIEYVDSKKQVSKRTVTAMRIKEEKNKDLYLVGLCHMRKRMRSFRYDRIQSIIENGTKRSSTEWLIDIGFNNFRDTKEHIAREKLRGLVAKMDDGALDDFIKNSTAAGV